MQRKWFFKNRGRSIALVFLLSLLLSLGAVMPAVAQDSMVRNCSVVEGTQLIAPQVVAGDATGFFLRQDQKLWGWGKNDYGQVGNGEIITGGDPRNGQQPPVLLTDEGFNQGFKHVASGRWHSLGVKNDGTVWGWGNNEKGQLGQMAAQNHSSPQQIPGLQDMTAVAGGEFFSLALDKDGYVWAWGNNTDNELGRGSLESQSNTPEKVKGLGGDGYLDNVKAIACGRFHGLALKNDGTVWAWGGGGNWGVLGNGEDFSDEIYPVQVLNLSDVKSIEAGDHFSLALKNDGMVWAWGARHYVGRLGDGLTDETENHSSIPVQVHGFYNLGYLSDVKAITCGETHSLAVKKDGKVWAWGYNYGALGDGEDDASSTPVETKDITDVVSIAAGCEYSLALKNDGTVWGWGTNDSFQLGIEQHDNYLPVQVEGIPQLARPLTGLSVQMADGSGPAQLLTCFTPNTTGYTMTVENPLEAVKITPTPVAGATAVVKVNGTEQNDGIVNLVVDPGLNKVEIVVSEEGKDDLTYTIEIKRLRLAEPLTGLSVKGKADGSGIEYLTGFAGNTFTYRTEVENTVDVVKVVPTAVAGTTAVVKLNGAVQSGGVVNLAAGWNPVTVEVTQPDRTKRSYSLDIGRKPSWQQGYDNWPVEASKNWNVQFNKPVNTATAADNIYVTAADGNRVQVELNWSDGNKKVTVKPQQNYSLGARYTLHIKTSLQDADGTALKTAVAMPFVIKP